MELVDDVLALQSQVKTLENQVKLLQQAQKSASSTKPTPAPVVDVSAIRQQLRSEFVTQLTELRTEVDQLKTQQVQNSVASAQGVSFRLTQMHLAFGVLGLGLLLLLLTYFNKPSSTAQASPLPNPPVTSVKAEPKKSPNLTKASKRTAKKGHPVSQPKSVPSLSNAEMDQATRELEAQGYGRVDSLR